MRHKPQLFRGFSVRQLFALVGVLLVVASGFVSFASKPQAATAAPATINFQARLENNSGSIAADGDYNVEFKIYNTQSTGGTAQGACTGACQWVETRTGTDKIHVVNGYLTANLGSVTAFSGTMPWDTDLWITMNIGGTGSPSWDGEMSPRLKLTAVPYAFQAAQASKLQVTSGGNTATLQFGSFAQPSAITLPDPGVSGAATVCYQGSASCNFAASTGAAGYIQNGTGVQTNANFNIRSNAIGSVGAVIQGANGQTADLLQLQSWNGTTNTNVFAVSAAGVVTLAGGQTIDVTTATAASANGLVFQPGVSSGASATGAAIAVRGGDVSGTTGVAGGQVTIQGGNATGASGTRNGGGVTIDGGTGATAAGAVNIGTANAPTINVGSVGTTAKATAIHIGDTTTTTAGAIQSVTIGSNSNLAHTTVIQGGSGNTAGSEAIRIVPQTAGGIAIGSTSGTGTITLGQSTAANTINIGSANFTAANTQTVNIANGLQTTAASTLNVNILSNAGNGTSGTARLNLANSDRVTQVDIGNVVADAARTLNVFAGNSTAVDTINIGTGASTAAGGKTIHIGDGTPTGSGTNLITIGTAANASTTTVQGGTGTGAVSIQAGVGGTIGLGTSTANNISIGSTNASTGVSIRAGAGVNIGDGGVPGILQIGNSSGAVSQTINIGNNNTSGGASTITIGGASNAGSSVTINAGATAGNTVLLQGNNSTGGVKVKSATNSTAAFLVQDSSTNNYLNVDTSGAAITIGYASSSTTLNGTVKVATTGSATANSQLLCRDSSTNILTDCSSTLTGNAFVQGGNGFGTLANNTAILGTTDTNNLLIETNGVARATFDQSNGLYLGNGVTAATPNNFTVAGTGSATAGTTGGQLNINGGAGATATTGSAGGVLNLSGGNAGGTGNNVGGNVTIQGGTGSGTGARGSVILQASGGNVGIGTTPNSAYKLDVAGDINISSGSKFRVNGADINTGGTLSNVAYLDQNNSFTGLNTFSRNGGTGAGDYTLGVTGTPGVTATGSLFRLGAAIASGNAVANGGTFIGINAQASGAGSAADFVNFQANGTVRLQLTNAGDLTVSGKYNTNTFTASGLQFGAGSTATVQAAASQALNLTGHATSAFSTDAGDLGISAAANLNIGNTGGTAINIGTNAGAHTIGIGTGAAVEAITIGSQNTTSSTTINGGTGAGAISLQAGTSGTILIGNTNNNGITIGGSTSVINLGNLGSTSGNAAAVCRDTSTTQLINCDANTTGKPFLQGGNTFGATASLGTNDANNLQFKTNNTVRATFDQSNGLYLGLGITAASPTAFTVAGTGSATAGTTGGALTIQGGAGATATTGSVGGALNLNGGAAGGTGNNNGGAVAIQGGTATGTGTVGNVSIQASGGNLGVGTATPTRTLDVAVNNSTVNALPVLIEQAGSGDSGIEFKTGSRNFYTGIDNTDGMFKISSSAAANGTTTMGNPFQEASSDVNGGRTSALQALASASGSVSSIGIYFQTVDGSVSLRAVQVGIYANQTTGCNAGLNPCPGALLGTSAVQTATTGLNTFPVTGATVTSGSTYWIALSEQVGSNNVYYDSGSGGTMAYTAVNVTNYPIPATFTKALASGDRASFFATISISGSADNFSNPALFRLSDTGAATFQNSVNSTNAFQVQNATGMALFNADTTNSRVYMGVTGSTATAGIVSVGTSTGAAQTVNIGSDFSGSASNGTQILIQGGNNASAVSIQSLASGTVSIGTTAAGSVTIGNASGTTTLQGTVKVSTLGAVSANATAVCRDTSTSQLISCDTNTSARPFIQGGNTFGAAATLGTNDSNTLAFETNNVTRATFDTSNNLYLGLGVTAAAPTAFTIQTTGSSAATVAGAALTVKGGTGNTTGAGGAVTVQGGTGGTSGQGGALTLQGGSAGGGNTNGGNVNVTGGTGAGSGVTGLVVINTPTFQTSNMQTCTGTPNPCIINQADIDGNGAVVLTATTTGVNVTLNDPSLAASAKGRILYVTAALGSSDFTLVVNGGGTGNQIAMRANTTATMVWNGTDWTAAGASSSTTLQAAYDNTLTSAGGAELVVANTANANGLTIRDSSSNPVNGTLLEVQNSTAANLFSVNSNVSDYASDPGAEVAGGTSTTFPASTWAANGSAGVTRYTTAGNNIATGIASVQTITTAAAGDGVKNTLSTTLTANNHYNVSFEARLASGTFTDMDVYYSINGTTLSVLCTSGQAIKTSVNTKVNCTFTAPSSGITGTNAILIRQTGGAIHTFYVDNLSVTVAADFNLATDGGVDDAANFGTNWVTAGLGTVSVTRNTGDGNDASDSAQAAVTTGAANAGMRNKLSINPLASTLYRVSVYAKLNSGAAFTDFKMRYSRDGGTNFADCADYNTQTVVTGSWTQITCYITTDSTAPSNPYVYFVETASAVRTFSIDTFSITLAQTTTPNVQIGGGLNGGPTTLFTVDRGASAPIAANNDAFLGSMYYDTTLGKLQCYESDGWGACGSSPDNIVTISPEYTNAVLHGTGVGTMTSDVCSDQLNINDGSSSQPTICGSNETFNFYKWTSPQASAQTYSIYVTYQLPATFKSFQSGSTSLMGRTDSSSSTVQYTVYRNSAAGLSQCGSTVSVSNGSVSSWQPGPATGAADPSTCGFAANNSIVFKIDVIASVNASAYVGNLGFTYTNQ